MKKEKKNKTNIIRNFLYAVKMISKKDKLFVIESIICCIISSLVSFMYPYILKIAVSAIENGTDFKGLAIEVTLIIAIVCLLCIINTMLDKDQWRRQSKLSTIMVLDYNMASLKTDYEKFELPEAQDAFEKGMRALRVGCGVLGLTNNMFITISKVITFIIGCGLIFQINYLLIIIILVLSVFKLLLKSYNTKINKKNFYDKTPIVWRKISYTDNISRNLTIGKDLRIYEMDKFINAERDKAVSSYLKMYRNAEIKTNIVNGIINVLKILDELALYFFMIYQVVNGEMEIANFTFLVSIIRQMTNSLMTIINKYSNNLSHSLQINDYREFMKMDLSVNDSLISLEADEVEVEFRNVSYSYYMQEGETLKNLSFKIKKGERIALVGDNGAGKTTLVKLLCGFYHPTSGEILINGVNIEKIKRSSLQKLIAPVFQDTMHYAISILENISMKEKDTTSLETIKGALKLVDLEDRINNLPNGLDTIITRDLDDNGIELSGGESQKLAIARAIYKNAPMIVLDEPTSALDALAEYNLYNNFNKIIKHHSAIFISHRLSSTRFCDRIFYLNDGMLKEVGTHKQLMSYESEYKKLFDMQAEYYKGGKSNED